MSTFLTLKNKYILQLEKLYDRDHAIRVLGWLLEKITGKSLAMLMIDQIVVSEEQERQLAEWITKLVEEEYPLQYILGTVAFGNVTIAVEPPVLIPRPETEEWVCNVLNSLQHYKNEPLRILDMCAGSGCIAIAAAHYFKNAHIDAVDLYQKPLELTQRNAQLNGCENVSVIQSDLFTGIAGKQYDIIFSNPPYIDEAVWQTLSPTVKTWEDKNALVADNKGLALYEKIILLLPQFLKKNSVIQNAPRAYLEIGCDQGASVSLLFKQARFAHVTVHKDFADHDRMVDAF